MKETESKHVLQVNLLSILLTEEMQSRCHGSLTVGAIFASILNLPAHSVCQ